MEEQLWVWGNWLAIKLNNDDELSKMWPKLKNYFKSNDEAVNRWLWHKKGWEYPLYVVLIHSWVLSLEKEMHSYNEKEQPDVGYMTFEDFQKLVIII